MSKKVLFVDDESELISVFEEIIGQFDRRLIFALSARDAIEVLKVHDVGLVICDYWMPKGKGTEILDYLLQSGKPIDFCFFTGRPVEDFTDLRGINCIYRKPEDMKLVLNRIHAFLRSDIA